jgi:peptidoglycan/LPS O-acetylase OafA/YrhL
MSVAEPVETTEREGARRASAGDDGSRVLPLDVLRAVAILLVLFTHTIVAPKEAGSWRGVAGYLGRLGPTGVDLFFVLSGFLVGGLLFRELRVKGHVDVRRFLIRRAFRIWPSYFVFVAGAFVLLVARSGDAPGEALDRLLPNLVHAQNYLGSPREHTWSLAVEEHFYLVLPVLVLLWTRLFSKKSWMVPAAAGTLALGCGLLRLQVYGDLPSYNPHYATHLRIDALFFGVMLGYLHHFHPHRLAFAGKHRGLMLTAGLVLVLPYPALVVADQGNLIVGSIGFTMLFVGYGLVLLAAVAGTRERSEARPYRAAARVLARIGFFSYPIYLWHIDAAPLAEWFDTRALGALPAEVHWLLGFVIFAVVAIVVGTVFALVLERPALAVRDRFFPSRARPI